MTEKQHRWSGWPGAYCLDCGLEDMREICVGTCSGAFIRCKCSNGCDECCYTGVIVGECPIHINYPCLE